MPDRDTAGRSYQKASTRRAQILARAIELFAERGVGASLRAIGEAIGVSHAALRYYFASRDVLLVEVYREHETASYDVRSERSVVAAMAHSAQQNRDIPGLVELYATLTTDALQPDRHPAAHAFIVERFRTMRADLADHIRNAQRDGIIDRDIDPVDAAALVIAASDGLQVQWLLEPETVDVSRGLTLLQRLLPGATTSS